MKMRFIDRLLSAIAGFVVILLGIAGLLVLTGLLPLDGSLGAFMAKLPQWAHIVLIVFCVILLGLGLHGVLLLLCQKKEANFVKQETDNGKLSISLNALEIMARKCAQSHKNVTVKRVEVTKTVSGVQVDIWALVPSGVNIPEVIGKLQRHVRQYVGDCSGVMVDGVAVQIETDTSVKAIIPAKLMSGDEEEEQTAAAPESEPQAEAVKESASSPEEIAEEIVKEIVEEKNEQTEQTEPQPEENPSPDAEEALQE